MSQILCVACFIALFQLGSSNVLLVILISDYGLLLEKTITLYPSHGDYPNTPHSKSRHVLCI